MKLADYMLVVVCLILFFSVKSFDCIMYMHFMF